MCLPESALTSYNLDAQDEMANETEQSEVPSYLQEPDLGLPDAPQVGDPAA